MPRELFKDRGGKWRFRVTGKNGEKVSTSEAYYSSGNARRGYNELRAIMIGDEDL